MGNREQVAELIASLEQATLMSHQIGTAVERNQLLQISSSLRTAHHRLSALLLSAIPSPSPPSDNSVSSVDPMQLGEEEEEDGEADAVEKVEEKMRECFIRNKRAKKRPLSPSSAVVETSATEERSSRDYYGQFDLDPNASKLRALDLIYQFHG